MEFSNPRIGPTRSGSSGSSGVTKVCNAKTLIDDLKTACAERGVPLTVELILLAVALSERLTVTADSMRWMIAGHVYDNSRIIPEMKSILSDMRSQVKTLQSANEDLVATSYMMSKMNQTFSNVKDSILSTFGIVVAELKSSILDPYEEKPTMYQRKCDALEEIDMSHSLLKNIDELLLDTVISDSELADYQTTSSYNEKENDNHTDILVESESHLDENHASVVADSVTSSSQEDAPKKSYASILSLQMKKGPIRVYVPTNTAKLAQAKQEKQPLKPAAEGLCPETSTRVAPDDAPESKVVQNEVEGHSIYVSNLPLNITDAQLEAEFQKFGTVKPNGVQVRSSWERKFCFGFVEFQEFNSMQNAIKASPLIIGDRQATVEIKRTTTRAQAKQEKQPLKPAADGLRPETSTRVGPDDAPESKVVRNEVEGHSIYVRNLPLNITDRQLEAEFQKFGTVKPNGVQVRSSWEQKFCFGFVKFQEFNSMQNAIKASPLIIGDRQATVEIKRTTTRVGNGRVRFMRRVS